MPIDDTQTTDSFLFFRQLRTALGEFRLAFASKNNLNEVHGSDDLDYMRDASVAVLQQAPGGGRLILWSTAIFLLIALVWSALAELDEVTRGEGKVIPSTQIQIVQNLEGGILSEILIKPGDVVKNNQVILKIDDTRFSSSFREGRVNFAALQAKAARLKAEADGLDVMELGEVNIDDTEVVKQEQLLFESRKQELANTLSILEQQLAQRQQELSELQAKAQQLKRSLNLVKKELSLTRPLVNDGAISEVEVLRLERQVNDLSGELQRTRLAIPSANAKLSEAKAKREEQVFIFRNEAREEYNQVASDLRRLNESNMALEDRVNRTEVRSPVNGTIKQVMVSTIGGVIQPGMDLVEIVPLDDTLVIEARIRPADIAFLHSEQKATVKFTAYDYAIYGGLDAKVEHISADTITDEQGDSYYLVKVRTDKNSLGTKEGVLPIIPGMLTNVDILTGKKTVLDYLLKPVLKAREKAMRER